MMKILILNGPNLNLLGSRENEIYGSQTLDSIHTDLQSKFEKSCALSFYQSNHEGKLVDKIQALRAEGFAGMLINAAAFTHTSIAIRDAIAAVKLPAVEVHLSNVYAREEFRKTSYIASVCLGQVAGFGPLSYELGLQALLAQL